MFSKICCSYSKRDILIPTTCCPFPLIYAGDFLVLKNLFWGRLEFFAFKGRDSPYGGGGGEGGEGFNFNKLNCILVLWFSQFSRWYSCIILIVLSCLYYYIKTLFLKFEHGQIIIYVYNFFLYFKYDGFLTYFRVIVVLIIYVMQVCEFSFTEFTFIQLVHSDVYMRYIYFIIVYLRML